MFQDLKIHVKLLIGFGLVTLCVGFSGLAGVFGTREIADAFHTVASGKAPELQALLEIKSAAHEIEAQTTAFEYSDMRSTVTEGTPGAEKKFLLLEKVEKLEKWMSRYEQYESNTPAHADFLEEVREVKDQLVVAALEFVRFREQGIIEAQLLAQKKKFESARTRLQEVVQEVVDEELQDFHNHLRAANKIVERTMKISLAATVFTLVFALWIGIVLFTSVATPILKLRNVISAIAEGKLGQRAEVGSKDEIGELSRSFNTMADWIQREIENRRNEEKKNRLILETANDAFVAVDSENLIVDWNRQAEKIFGWKREEAVGRTLVELIIPAQYREAHKKGFERYLATGEGPVLNKRVELSALNVKGEEFPIEITIWPVRTDKTVFFNAFIQDITERKRLESVLLRSEKMAMVGQLAFGVAHEVKNPLAVLVQGVDYLKQHGKSSDKNVPQLLSDMTRAVERADYVVRGLLELGRPTALDLKPEKLGVIIESALLLLKRQLDTSQIHVVKNFKANLPKVSVDRGKMLGLFVNLLSNAAEAMPSGGSITITTALQKLTEAGSQVGDRKEDVFKMGQEVAVIGVEDTGSGIPEDVLPHIFDPFFTTKRGKGGTGLGLSVARNIVQIHRGTIEITNRKEGGARVTVLLPVG